MAFAHVTTRTLSSESVVMRHVLAAVLLLALAGCTTVQPTDVERTTVCMAMNEVASYGWGAGMGLEVATIALTNNGRTADEAAEIIETVIRTDCPQYRQFL